MKRQSPPSLLAVVLLLVVIISSASFAQLTLASATTIGTNITTAGTLTVTGLSTFGNASSTQFTTTGSTYLATTGGNVGIGTTNPGSALDVQGSLITRSDSTHGTYFSSGDWFQDVGYVRGINSNTNGMAFDIIPNGTTGSMGVWLDIVDRDIVANGLTNYETLKIGKTYNGGAFIHTTAAGSGVIKDLTLQGTGGNVIISSGKVSIGINSVPMSKLDVTDSTTVANSNGSEVLRIGAQYNSTVGSGARMGFYTSSFTTEAGRIYFPSEGSSSVGFSLWTYTSSNGVTEKFRITGGGNVGIGTSTPSQKLDVNGTINIEGAANGIIMHDTATASCYLVQVTNGALALTSHACQ